MALDYIRKSDADPNAKKRREVNIGLVNNATGAAFGAIATGQAVDAARRKVRNPNAPEPVKLSTRALRALRTKSPRFASAVKRVTPKDPKKALIGLGAVNVGGQLLNAGLDAQSTAYFARERKNLAAKKTNNVEKFDNGMGSGVELRKSAPPGGDKRMSQQQLAQMAGAAAVGGGAVLGANRIYGPARVAREDKVPPRSEWVKRGAPKAKKMAGRAALPLALIGGGGYLSHRAHQAARSERRSPWY